MVVGVVPYDSERHSQDYYDMLIEYGTWLDQEVLKHYNTHLIANGDVKKLTEGVIPIWTKITPPQGITYIVEVDSKAAGMGRLSTLSDGIGARASGAYRLSSL